MSQLENIGNYWNSRAEGYSDTIHHEMTNGVAGFYADKLKMYSPEREHMKCLDVGCGPGLFSILLFQQGHEVTSVDYSTGMLEKAKENIEEAGYVPDLVRGDATHLPFEDESYDYIVSRNLVWNLENPVAAYREWMRVLKPGGRILVIDSNHYLHYYDEEYMEARVQSDKLINEIKENIEYGHQHMKGVDPTPINEIARELPLSKIHRPEWDMGIFRNLGVATMRIDTRPEWYHNQLVEQKVIGEFFVCAEKWML